MKKINRPLFIVCLIGFILLTGLIVGISVMPINIAGSYSLSNITDDKMENFSYYFTLNNYLIIDEETETYIVDAPDVEYEKTIRCKYKLKNGNIYIDLNSIQTHEEEVGWSEVVETDKAWTIFTKNINSYYFKTSSGYAINYQTIGAVIILTILDIIFLVKMIEALKTKILVRQNEEKPIIRYNEITGEPYEVKPTGYNQLTGEPEYNSSNKSKLVYGLLGIFLGFVGAQQFYGKKYVKGIFSALFFWTGIPFFIGVMTGIFALCTPQNEFEKKYIKQ